jgi:hypothetical protein
MSLGATAGGGGGRISLLCARSGDGYRDSEGNE